MEANFWSYYNYGNHSTLTDNPTVAYRTLLNDDKRGYCLIFDQRLAPFVLNAHFMPNGLVNPTHPTKEPCQIFDSSFCPTPAGYAINDWTPKHTEPPLYFGESMGKYLSYLYNLRATYPYEEIFLGDNDISGAFRHQKYHPNVVAMHCFKMDEYFVVATGTTFGDGPSPSNFEPIAWAHLDICATSPIR